MTAPSVDSISSQSEMPNIYSFKQTLSFPNMDSLDVYRCLKEPNKESFLIEFNYNDRRTTVISCEPLITMKAARDQKVEYKIGQRKVQINSFSAIEVLRLLSRSITTCFDSTDSFAQSLFSIFSYDSVRQFEKRLFRQDKREKMPDIWATIPKSAVILDLDSRECNIVVNTFSPEYGLEELKRLVKSYSNSLKKGISPMIDNCLAKSAVPKYNVTMKEFCDAVHKAKEYIKSGDIFQVVLSIESAVETQLSAEEIYHKMVQVNSNTTNYIIETDSFSIVGASPEILIEKNDNKCIIKPLAGTIHHSGGKDESKEKELLSNEKDCAEHRMLVDLARNDLGRVCKWGTVLPKKLMHVEYYNNVMHIVSEVIGEIGEEFDSFDLFKAGFPAGTMVGAPKIRAMEIIDELENIPRGFYSGGVGFFTPKGNINSYINIRSLTLIDKVAYARAGAGIVYDSIPEQEYNECFTKLKNALTALKCGV